MRDASVSLFSYANYFCADALLYLNVNWCECPVGVASSFGIDQCAMQRQANLKRKSNQYLNYLPQRWCVVVESCIGRPKLVLMFLFCIFYVRLELLYFMIYDLSLWWLLFIFYFFMQHISVCTWEISINHHPILVNYYQSSDMTHLRPIFDKDHFSIQHIRRKNLIHKDS